MGGKAEIKRIDCTPDPGMANWIVSGVLSAFT